MAFEQVKVRIVGATPLFMHSNRGVNPRDALVIELKKITGKRGTKTEEDQDTIARIEWELGLYFDKELGPVLKAEMIHATMRDAAKRTKQGKLVLESVWIDEPAVKLEYDGPRDIEGLYADGRFFDLRPARIQGRTINRARPIFLQWAARFTVSYDAEFIDHSDVLNILEQAGRRIGVGDYRPTHGRFTVEEVA